MSSVPIDRNRTLDERCLRHLVTRPALASVLWADWCREPLEEALEDLYGRRESVEVMKNVHDQILLSALRRTLKPFESYAQRQGKGLEYGEVFAATSIVDMEELDSDCAHLLLSAKVHALLHFICDAAKPYNACKRAVYILRKGERVDEASDVAELRQTALRLIKTCAKKVTRQGKKAMVLHAVAYEKEFSITNLIKELKRYAQGISDYLGVLWPRSTADAGANEAQQDAEHRAPQMDDGENGELLDEERDHEDEQNRSRVERLWGPSREDIGVAQRDAAPKPRNRKRHLTVPYTDDSYESDDILLPPGKRRVYGSKRYRAHNMGRAGDLRTVGVAAEASRRDARRPQPVPLNDAARKRYLGSSAREADRAKDARRGFWEEAFNEPDDSEMVVKGKSLVRRGSEAVDKRGRYREHAANGVDADADSAQTSQATGEDEEEEGWQRSHPVRRSLEYGSPSTQDKPANASAARRADDDEIEEDHIQSESARQAVKNLRGATNLLEHGSEEDPVDLALRDSRSARYAARKGKSTYREVRGAREPSPFYDSDESNSDEAPRKAVGKNISRKHRTDISLQEDEWSPTLNRRGKTSTRGKSGSGANHASPSGTPLQRGPFSKQEDELLLAGLKEYGWGEWQRIADNYWKDLPAKRSSCSLKDRARTMRINPNDYPPVFAYKRPGRPPVVLPVLRSREDGNTPRSGKGTRSQPRRKATPEHFREEEDTIDGSGDEHEVARTAKEHETAEAAQDDGSPGSKGTSHNAATDASPSNQDHEEGNLSEGEGAEGGEAAGANADSTPDESAAEPGKDAVGASPRVNENKRTERSNERIVKTRSTTSARPARAPKTTNANLRRSARHL